MVDVNVEFVLGQEEPIEAEFILEPDVTYTAEIVLNVSTVFHDELYHLDYPDQHPISAIIGLSAELSNLTDAIETEKERAESSENILNGKIDDEISRALLSEGNLSDRITSEVDRATEKENQLADDILAENNRALSAEETLQDNIDNEENRAKGVEQSLADDISEEVNNRISEITRVEGLISDEETRAKGIEQGLRDDLTAETNRATNAEGVLQSNITAEENRAKGVEEQLASSIDSNHQAISNHVSNKNNPHEVTKAQVGLGNVENLAPADMPMSTATKTYVDNADNGLQGQITAINTTIGGYGNIVTHNVSEFATASQGALADTSLQPNDNISELTNNLNYQTATQVANSIAVETGNREAADNNLQSQIDAIVSASDVFDIVGTYAELQAYDISTVPVNDIIKVLEDSTHGGAATYYRCVENNNVKSWSYIGSEGASYTKDEADNKFVPQTRTVNNKALSSDITLTASDVGALPSSTVIPTVNDATVTIQKNGSTVSTFTLNQSSNETVNITVPTKTSDIANDSGFITSADLPTNYVTTDTTQDIDSVKTFLGEKAILFKQKVATNKLGFTLYNPTGTELGAFEWRPNTISGGALLNINVPYTSSNWAGFRYWGTAVNIIAPKVAIAGNYYIPVNITDGTNTVTATSNGTVDISSLLPNSAVWGNITGTLSDQTDLQNALNAKANDSDVVKTTGNQTVAGIKTFTNGLERSAALGASGSIVTELIDTNGKGSVQNISYYAGNEIYNRIQSGNTTAGKSFYLDVRSTDTGNGVVSISGSATNLNLTQVNNLTNSNTVATMGWVNNPATSTNVVHRSGDETIGGNKTFVAAVNISSDSGHKAVYARDRIEFFPLTTTTHGGFIDFHYAGSGADYTSRIIENSSGNLNIDCTSVTAPTPATSDNSNKIATTAFVKNQGYWRTMTYAASTKTLTWS